MNQLRYVSPHSLNSRLESFLNDPLEALKDLPGLLAEELNAEARAFPGALFEDDAGYHARFELPGWRKEDVTLELHQDLLTVSCQRGEDEKKESLSRKLRVPDGLNAEGVTATMEEGLLTVTLPKAEAKKPRTIELS